jgi:hypothetical protein
MSDLENLRARLHALLAEGKQLTDPKVVKVSQELDGLVNAEMGWMRGDQADDSEQVEK